MGDLSVFLPSPYRYTPSARENENLIPFERFQSVVKMGDLSRFLPSPYKELEKKTEKSLPCVKGGGPPQVVEGLFLDRKHNKKNVSLARILRKNMTKEERHLWYDFLRAYPIKFLRQKPFGKYILDFYSAEAKLVIELDGSRHYDTPAMENDVGRTAYLEQYGLTVLRIPNNQVMQNFEGTCMYIDSAVKQSLSSLREQLPLHKGAEELQN